MHILIRKTTYYKHAFTYSYMESIIIIKCDSLLGY